MPRALRYTLYGLLGCLLAFSCWVANLVILPSEASTLRDTLLAEHRDNAHLQFQLHLDRLTTLLVRQVVKIAAPLNREQRVALESVRAAAVGVYRLDKGTPMTTDLATLDARMRKLGWHRFLVVDNARKGELVAGYLPDDLSPGADLPLCLAVRDHEELVVVSARARLQDVATLASAKIAAR